MKTIKLSLVAFATFFVIGANAQVGLQAGYSNSKETGSGLSLNGFHIGPAAEMTIQGPISLQYALLYNYHLPLFFYYIYLDLLGFLTLDQ